MESQFQGGDDMTKSELINRVAERLPYLTRKDAEIIVNTIFDSMVDALVQGDRIEIRGFGSFKVKNRGNREGRNPKTGESVRIPAKRMPFFKIGKELYERINQGSSSFDSAQERG
jgi:integration host factor beta subunit